MNRFVVIACLGLAMGSAGLADETPKPAAKAAHGKTGNKKNETSLDFEGGVVKGERLNPMGSILEQAQPDQDYNFVKIRNNWRKEMVNSPDSLDTKVLKLGIEDE